MKEPKAPSKFKSRLFLALAVVVIFAAGAFGGFAYANRQSPLGLTKFWQVYSLLRSDYVGNVDANAATDGAIKGLVASLGDPYSEYLPPSDKKALDDDLSGQFEGIGAELTVKDGVITVVAPLAGSPAEAAGIKAQDVVAKIDGTSTDNLTLDQAVAKIRGTKGTKVTLAVLHPGDKNTTDITITRDTVTVPSVTYKMIGDIGYINIAQFGDDTVDLTNKAAQSLAAQNPKGVVLDLRNNPGGFLDDVPPIAGLFLPPSVVVQEKYKDGHTDSLRSTAVPTFPNTPLEVLVNGGSASAAEILAGALQDYKRGTLIGEKTFGKGSVQIIKDLGDGSALRVTIAEWLTPNGRGINKVGITPDVASATDKQGDTDPALTKAEALIHGQ